MGADRILFIVAWIPHCISVKSRSLGIPLWILYMPSDEIVTSEVDILSLRLLRKKTIYGYVQGLGGYSRDPRLARNTLQVSGKRQISLHDTGIDRYSGSGIRQNLKENGIRDRDDRSSGCRIVMKESGNTGSGQPPILPDSWYTVIRVHF